MKNRSAHARAARIQAMLRNHTQAENELRARALLDAITDEELKEQIAELDAKLGGPMSDEQMRALADSMPVCGYAERARHIFDGQPELLKRCEERLAARAAALAH